MIKIKKSSQPPKILKTKGEAETKVNNNLYDSDPQSYKNEKDFTFDSEIYGHKSVKNVLIAEQHKKCCFCEARFTANSYGDVEHFRPKGGYRPKKDAPLKKPGYYWKAYSWDNLLFSCKVCNTTYKRNYFPLEDETQRAIDHHDNIDKEKPLLIHPALDDPGTHIYFHQDECFSKDKKGEESIKAYGINRDELIEARNKHLQCVKQSIAFAKINLESMPTNKKNEILELLNMSEDELNDLIYKAKELIKTAAKDESIFSLMIRNNFPELQTK